MLTPNYARAFFARLALSGAGDLAVAAQVEWQRLAMSALVVAVSEATGSATPLLAGSTTAAQAFITRVRNQRLATRPVRPF